MEAGTRATKVILRDNLGCVTEGSMMVSLNSIDAVDLDDCRALVDETICLFGFLDGLRHVKLVSSVR